MRVKFKLMLLSVLILCNLEAGADSQYDWKLVRDQDGIQIYLKKIWADPVKAFRGVIHIGASVDSLAAIILDIKSSADWIHHCKDPVLLFRKSFSECYHYQIHQLPFPFHNREFIFHSKLSRITQTGAVQIKMDIAQDFCRLHSEKCECINTPSTTSHVKVSHSHGHYLLEPVSHNFTRVTWTHHTHPGGNLPLWIVNHLIQEMPYKTLQGLRNKACSKKYQNAILIFNARGEIINLRY